MCFAQSRFIVCANIDCKLARTEINRAVHFRSVNANRCVYRKTKHKNKNIKFNEYPSVRTLRRKSFDCRCVSFRVQCDRNVTTVLVAHRTSKHRIRCTTTRMRAVIITIQTLFKTRWGVSWKVQ